MRTRLNGHSSLAGPLTAQPLQLRNKSKDCITEIVNAYKRLCSILQGFTNEILSAPCRRLG